MNLQVQDKYIIEWPQLLVQQTIKPLLLNFRVQQSKTAVTARLGVAVWYYWLVFIVDNWCGIKVNPYVFNIKI